jgi:uncharacterized protein YkwD
MCTRDYLVTSFLSGLVICALLMSCAVSQPHKPDHHFADRKSNPHVHAFALEKQIHALVNRERKKEGLPLLAWSAKLADIARGHSQDMAKRNYFDHRSPEGHDYLSRYGQAGYSCSIRVERAIYLGAENIAQNNLYNAIRTINGKPYFDWNSQEEIAKTTVMGWMESPGHKKNILTPYFRSEGIGIFIGPDDKIYITQNFC